MIPICSSRHVFVRCAVKADSTLTRRKLHDVNIQHLLCVQLCVDFVGVLSKSYVACCVQGKADRAVTIDVHTHRFLDVHSSYKTNPRSTHDATGFAGEVLILCTVRMR